MTDCHGATPGEGHTCVEVMTTIETDPIANLELQLIARGRELADAEKARDEEFLLHMISTKVSTFQAQKQADQRHGTAVREATAQYEIALARLRRI